MEKEKLLFVCVHNSARSQMAEAWMNHLCGDHFEAESAGLQPGVLNPLVVSTMKKREIYQGKRLEVYSMFTSQMNYFPT